jgi:hypothetical protein
LDDFYWHAGLFVTVDGHSGDLCSAICCNTPGTGDFIDDCRFTVFCQCYLAKIVLHPPENHPMDDCTFLHLDLFRLILFTG